MFVCLFVILFMERFVLNWIGLKLQLYCSR